MRHTHPLLVPILSSMLLVAPVASAGEAEILKDAPSNQDGAFAYNSLDMELSDPGPSGDLFDAMVGGAPGEDGGAGAVHLRLLLIGDPANAQPGDPLVREERYQVRIPHPEPTAGGDFGRSVKVRFVDGAPGTVEVVVSARNSSDGTGKVYIFEVIDGGSGPIVQLKQTLTEGLGPLEDYGRRITCSEDGSKLFVAAPRNNPDGATFAGTIFVYENQAGTLVKVQAIQRAVPQPGEELGDTLGGSDDGSTIIAGAPGKNIGSHSAAGEIVVFEENGGTYEEVASVGNGPGQDFERFPRQITDVVEDSAGQVVGSTFYATSDLGGLSRFTLDDVTNEVIQRSLDEILPPTSSFFGEAIDVSEDADGQQKVVVGDPDPNGGRCCVIVDDDQEQSLVEIIEALDEPANLGHAVAIDGNIVAAAAPSDDTNGSDTGAARLFSLNGLPFFSETGTGCNATGGEPPTCEFEGGTQPGTTTRFTAENVSSGQPAFLVIGSDDLSIPFKGCELLVGGPPDIIVGPLFSDVDDILTIEFENPVLVGPTQLDCQVLVAEGQGQASSSNRATIDFIP